MGGLHDSPSYKGLKTDTIFFFIINFKLKIWFFFCFYENISKWHKHLDMEFPKNCHGLQWNRKLVLINLWPKHDASQNIIKDQINSQKGSRNVAAKLLLIVVFIYVFCFVFRSMYGQSYSFTACMND